MQLPSLACTSVIVSGKATPDGRPLMWKNRDTGSKENLVMHFPAGDRKYAFTGIVNAKTKNPRNVWIGTNSEGFSIMNTHSYNITTAEDQKKDDDENGLFMRMALEKCSCIEDFERIMFGMPKPWKVSANFGVLDAKGGAAYYEVNYTEYFKYDANEAPDGWIVRTNFSLNGRPVNEGRGHVRFMEAENLIREATQSGRLTPGFILDRMARSYANPLLGTDYRDDSWKSGWALEHDTITRYKTTCSVVIQGVRDGENPDLSTMWTIVGYPGTTVTMPVWTAPGDKGIPALLRYGKDGNSELSHWAYDLKNKVYCYTLDDSADQKYFKWSLLWNEEGSGYLQKILAFESELLDSFRKALGRWHEAGKIDAAELDILNAEACKSVAQFYKPLL